MRTVVERGFTVIELMLFLAVSGLLFAMLMVGVGTNINQQMYRNDVTDFKTLLQDQYADVLTPQNISSTITCNSVEGDRGATSCVILGKSVQLDGRDITISNVIGFDTQVDLSGKTDIEAFQEYTPDNATDDVYREKLNITLKNTSAAGSGSMQSTMLVLRSPVNGLIRFYWASGLKRPADVLGNVSTQELQICAGNSIESASVPVQLITIDPAIAGVAAVSSQDSSGECPS